MPKGKPKAGRRGRRVDEAVPRANDGPSEEERAAWRRGVVQQVCRSVEAGVPAVHAAAGAGIHRSTWWRWLKENGDLREMVELAAGKAAAAHAVVITDLVTDPAVPPRVRLRAALAWLQARDRKHWRKEVAVEVDAGATLADLVAASFKVGSDGGDGGGGQDGGGGRAG